MNILAFIPTMFPNLNYSQNDSSQTFITNNLGLDLFKFSESLTTKDFDYNYEKNSIISFMLREDLFQCETKVELFNYILALPEDELSTLSKEESLKLLQNMYFELGEPFPDFYDIFDMDWRSGEYGHNEACNIRLSDPLYSFPELQIARKIQHACELTSVEVYEALDQCFLDFATYSVGSSNSDLKDEYFTYFEDFLKPALLNDTDMNILSEIETLREYRREVVNLKLEKELLGLLDRTSLNNQLLIKLRSMKDSVSTRENALPSKYNTIGAIDIKIENLITSDR